MRLATRQSLRSFLIACASRRSDQPMPMPLEHQVEGVIQSVDPIGRELVLLDGRERSFYVPLDCPIILNEERVKLRLLQPMDRATVRYTREHSHAVARSIVVAWDSSPAEIERPRAAGRPLAAAEGDATPRPAVFPAATIDPVGEVVRRYEGLMACT